MSWFVSSHGSRRGTDSNVWITNGVVNWQKETFCFCNWDKYYKSVLERNGGNNSGFRVLPGSFCLEFLYALFMQTWVFTLLTPGHVGLIWRCSSLNCVFPATDWWWVQCVPLPSPTELKKHIWVIRGHNSDKTITTLHFSDKLLKYSLISCFPMMWLRFDTEVKIGVQIKLYLLLPWQE